MKRLLPRRRRNDARYPMQQVAEQTIHESEVMMLAGEDSRAFVEALLAPPAPNECLRVLAERYKRTTVNQ